MCVHVRHHRRFLRNVLFALTGDFQTRAVPGVDGGFGGEEGVGVVEGQFRAEEFCCSVEDLFPFSLVPLPIALPFLEQNNIRMKEIW